VLHLKWDKLIGDEHTYAIEHRILNVMLLFGIIIGLLTGIFNYLFEFTIASIVSLIIIIIVIAVYYISLNKKQYFLSIWTMVLVIIVLIPVMWLYNGGITGGTSFYILMFSGVISILFRGFKIFAITGIILLIYLGLIIIEYYNLISIIGYASTFDRYSDYTFSLMIAIIANVSVYGITLNQYNRERERAQNYASKLEKKKTELQMARLENLNLIGEMAASIGHEVRNPLTTVRGYLQFFRGKKEYAHHIEQFDVMIEEIDRANTIITEFLSLEKNKAVKLQFVNINQTIYTLYPLIRASTLCERKELLLELDNNIPDIMADENEIRQLILNLTRNAQEAVAERGRIILSTSVVGDTVELTVKDNGRGIPQEILARLGTPFFTTKEKGTGLGLAVCYRIVERHNAKLVVETSTEGTKFIIKFNLKQQV